MNLQTKLSQIQIYVISLKGAVRRRKIINSLFNRYNIDFEYIDAVEGNQINDNIYNEINSKVSERTSSHINKMIKNEIGCAFSHLKAYEKILNNNVPFAIIFEDDIEFNTQFLKFINLVNLLKKLKYDLILLGYSDDIISYRKKANISLWFKKRIGQFIIGKPLLWYWGAFGYFITYNGAKKLLNAAYPIRMPADYLTTNSERYGLSFGVIEDPIVWLNPEIKNSTIGDRNNNIEVTYNRPPEQTIKPKLNIYKIFLKKIRLYIKIKLKPLRKFSLNPSKFYLKPF